jgi:hypothetical protein
LEKSRLADALNWRREDKPTLLWARRYPGDFAAAMAFLEESAAEAKRQQEKAAEKLRKEQDEAAEKLRNEERQAAEKLRKAALQAAERRRVRVMRWALVASVLLLLVQSLLEWQFGARMQRSTNSTKY